MMASPICSAERAAHYAKTIAWLDQHAREAEPGRAGVFLRASRKMAARAAAALQSEAHNDRG